MSIPKILISAFLLSISLQLRSQTISIPMESYPFSDIIEWKGKGAILINQDPSGDNKKINLTHVTDAPNSVWNQAINPRGNKQYLIYAENTRYVYFLDNLELEDNKYFFNQLNEAGTVKQSSTNLLTAFKKLGDYLPEDSELEDVVVTDKSLIHIFRHHNKKEKKYTQLAFIMTHNNFLLYPIILGEKNEKDLENENIGLWKYIGYDGDEALFAARDSQDRKNGFAVQRISSKGKLNMTQFIPLPQVKLTAYDNVGYGLNGSNYLDKKTSEMASLRTINGKIYGFTVENANESNKYKLWLFENATWNVLQETSQKNSKKTISVGITMLNEGLGLKIDNSSEELIFMPFDPSKKINILPFTKQSIYNPSRLLISEKPTQYVSAVNNGWLFFDYEQLKKEGEVKFEYSK